MVLFPLLQPDLGGRDLFSVSSSDNISLWELGAHDCLVIQSQKISMTPLIDSALLVGSDRSP